jgi:hypothetical protein
MSRPALDSHRDVTIERPEQSVRAENRSAGALIVLETEGDLRAGAALYVSTPALDEYHPRQVLLT